MARSLGMMKAEMRDLLEELGSRGFLSLAKSVCDAEVAALEKQGRLGDALVWRIRAEQVSHWQDAGDVHATDVSRTGAR